MGAYSDCEETIKSLDEAREEALKEIAAAQEDLEGMFARYMFSFFICNIPMMESYAKAIKEHNEGIRVFLDFQVETFEKSSNLLKRLLKSNASEEKLKEGLAEVDSNLEELNKRAEEFLE